MHAPSPRVARLPASFALVALVALVPLVTAGRARALSIEEAMEIAVARSEAVEIAEANIDRAHADQQRAFSEFLPQVFGHISYDRAIESEYRGILDVPTPGGQEQLQNLPFGQPNIWRAGFSVSQNVFAGGRSFARLKLTDRAMRTSESSLESSRAQAVLVVVQAYYDALLARQLTRIAEENLRQAEATLAQARAQYANDATAAFDVLRAEVTVGNQRPTLLSRQSALANAEQNLRQVLDLPPGAPLELTSTLEGPLADLGTIARERSGIGDEQTRVSVRQQEDLVFIRLYSLDIAKSQHFPLIDVNMSYDLVTYPPEIQPNLDDVRNNWIVGVALQMPLFTGFRINGDVRAAQADVLESKTRLRLAVELADLDEADAERQLRNALSALEASAGVVEQAREAAEISQIRYREGISTQLEVTDAQLLLSQAQANRAQAARDVQVARVRLALLPALPVTQTGAAGAAGFSPAGGAALNVGVANTGGISAGGASGLGVAEAAGGLAPPGSATSGAGGAPGATGTSVNPSGATSGPIPSSP